MSSENHRRVGRPNASYPNARMNIRVPLGLFKEVSSRSKTWDCPANYVIAAAASAGIAGERLDFAFLERYLRRLGIVKVARAHAPYARI